MPAKVSKLGPGTLTIGTGTPQDISCQLTGAWVKWTANQDDPVTVLCGDQVPGARTYTAVLSGTMFQDLSASGFTSYSWQHKGEQMAFTFTPLTASAGTKVSGTIIIDPVDIGGDEAGANMTADFEWPCVGTPTFVAALAADDTEALPDEAISEPVAASA